MSQTWVIRDNDGNILQENTITARLYESWWGVITMEPGMKAHGHAVLWHFGICFIISFAVWFITLRSRKDTVPAGEQAANTDGTPPDDKEESPHENA